MKDLKEYFKIKAAEAMEEARAVRLAALDLTRPFLEGYLITGPCGMDNFGTLKAENYEGFKTAWKEAGLPNNKWLGWFYLEDQEKLHIWTT